MLTTKEWVGGSPWPTEKGERMYIELTRNTMVDGKAGSVGDVMDVSARTGGFLIRLGKAKRFAAEEAKVAEEAKAAEEAKPKAKK